MKRPLSLRRLSIGFLIAVWAIRSISVFAAEQNTLEPRKPAAPALLTQQKEIPLADIAARATQVANLLRTLTTAAAPDTQIDSIAKSLPELSAKLDAQIAATTTMLEAQPTLETLQTLQQQWQRRQTETTGWLKTLTQRATNLQSGLSQLADLQKTWKDTRSAAQAANAPDPILQQIDTTLAAILESQAQLQSERAMLLDLQSRIAKDVAKCGAALTQIGRFQQEAVAGIFVPDAPPIWRADLWANSLQALPEHVRKVGTAHGSDLVKYAREPREGIVLHSALFAILVLVFCWARRQVAVWKKSGAPISPALSVFGYPYAAALATVLVFATSPFFQMAVAVRQLLFVVALVPLTRLVRPMVSSPVAPAIYALAFLFALETLRQAFAGIQLIGQWILVAETIAAIVVLISLRRRYGQILPDTAVSSRLILLKLVRYLLTILLIFSLLAGAAGYVRLARLLTPGILAGGVLALAAAAYLRVGAGVVALAFRIWPLRLLQIVEHHREFLAKRAYALMVWIAILGWSVRYLGYLGLLDPTWALAQSVLTAKIERGTIAISIGSIIEFILAVWLAYLLSRFLRFVLQEDVYPRIDLAPGLSYAVSSLLNYIVLAVGFVAGLGVLGVDFSKVSILAGAFGVGIGFGLQSIVNNFVSGLILLFERPIHVGDTVEVANLQGTVRRIGIRASVIHTGAGADIIVPNSQLVTGQVTNWTLSDSLRRVDLPVGVNYGADPKQVIGLLEQVARSHPDVLQDPAPCAVFTSFGDNSINFELRVWPKQTNFLAEAKSNLAAAVYNAVYDAGLSFPFPQREVRLLGDDAMSEAAPAAFSATRRPASGHKS